jgi:hypothetical protein
MRGPFFGLFSRISLRLHIQPVGCFVLLAALAGSRSPAQTAAQPPAVAKRDPAIVTSVHVLQDKGLPAVEIVTSHPVLPTIQMLDSPPRLVIDLANARIGATHKRTPVLQENLLTLRAEQFQNDPPITRIVLDLLVTYAYTWDVSGDTLMVRLKPAENPNVVKKSPRQTPQVLSITPTAAPVVVPVTSGVGDVVMAGKQFAAGSSLTAGSDTAVLLLSRGGEVRVCPGTTLSVTPAKKTKDLMLGMSTGAMETHYTLGSSADTVLTPDFRILFAGPGEFHYAVSTDSHGTTCVRGLKGNTSAALVSELIGDRIYQVRPNEQAVFRLGRIDKVDTDVPLECGCPPPPQVNRADAAPANPLPDSAMPANATLAQGHAQSEAGTKPPSTAPQVLSSGPEIRPVPPSQPDDVHIQVDAPLVYQGKKGTAAPASTSEAASPPATDPTATPARVEAQVQPVPTPEPPAKPQHRSVLRKIGRFFSAIWR